MKGIPSLPELHAALRAQGFGISTGTKHYKVWGLGGLVSVLPRSAGASQRGARNNLAELRRAGFVWPPPPKEKPVAHATQSIALDRLLNTPQREPEQNERRILIDQHAPKTVPWYEAKLGLNSAEYITLLTARRQINRPKLREAILAKSGGSATVAARAAGLTSTTSIRELPASLPTLPILERIFLYLHQPIGAFTPAGVGSLSWPPAAQFTLDIESEADGAKGGSEGLPEGVEETAEDIGAGIEEDTFVKEVMATLGDVDETYPYPDALTDDVARVLTRWLDAKLT